MSWFKVDDQSPFHPKVLAAGNEAWGAFCRMGAWSSAHRREGYISEGGAATITTKKVLQRLMDAGLLHKEEGGYRLHDYLDYNPTADQDKAKRDARAEAGRKGGLNSAQAKQQAKAQAIASTYAEQNGKQNPTPTRPDPTPTRINTKTLDDRQTDSTDKSGQSSSVVGLNMPKGNGSGYGPEADAILSEHPSWQEPLQAKVMAAPNVKSPGRYALGILKRWKAGDGTPADAAVAPPEKAGPAPTSQASVSSPLTEADASPADPPEREYAAPYHRPVELDPKVVAAIGKRMKEKREAARARSAANAPDFGPSAILRMFDPKSPSIPDELAPRMPA